MSNNQIPIQMYHQNVVKAIKERRFDDAVWEVIHIVDILDESLPAYPSDMQVEVRHYIHSFYHLRDDLCNPGLKGKLFGRQDLLLQFYEIFEGLAVDVFIPWMANKDVDLTRFILGGAGGKA